MNKITRTFRDKALRAYIKTSAFLRDKRGDLAVNSIGGIIVAVIVIGLLVVAIKAFFPGFFTSMFNSMKTKLDANW